ncbi:hypothetical protein CRUP_030160 [Coryphaenoides rupestris]|nr:hypothetical protein CRUP_030160 [Coryphaenoides rupestris]
MVHRQHSVDDKEHIKIKSTVMHTLLSDAGKGETKAAGGKMLFPRMYSIGGNYWHPCLQQLGEDMPDHIRERYSMTLLGANVYVSGSYQTYIIDALDTVSVYKGDE